MSRKLKPYACCGEHNVILCHVLSKCTPFEDQSYGVNNGSINVTVHVATRTCVQSQVRAQRTSVWELNMHNRAVVKKNSSTEICVQQATIQRKNREYRKLGK